MNKTIRKSIKFCRYILEAAIALPIYALLALLPISTSSCIMGRLFTFIGPVLKVNQVAEANITKCFPDTSAAEKKTIIKRMWNHLGRIVGELPHWHRMSDAELVKFVTLPKTLANSQVILISGHLGNWELNSRLMKYYNIKPIFVYRPMNNPMINWLINRTRLINGVELVAKGTSNLKEIIRGIKDGKSLGMLVDQRHDAGISLPFFGHETMTISAPANMAIKYNLPITMVMARRVYDTHLKSIRSSGIGFEFVSRAVNIEPTDSPVSVMKKIHLILEEWITTNKEQWFWLHKRWRD